MSTAADLEAAQAALHAAQARHDAEQAQRVEQDRAAASAYWQHVHAEVLPERVQAMQEARAAFSDAVATAGDVGAAYGTYVAAHAAWQATHNAVANGLVTYVNDLTGEPHPDPDERWGRATYPDGVQGPTHNAPDAFLSMLEAAAKAAHHAHAMATTDELHAAREAHR